MTTVSNAANAAGMTARRIIGEALTAGGIAWSAGYAPTRLEFSLPAHGVRIGVCDEWQERSVRRLEHHRNAILIQGPAAVALFAASITKGQR